MKFSFVKQITLLVGLLLFASAQLLAQQTVSGVVTHAEDGEALIGATVLIEGTAKGTVTDIDGRYELQAQSGDVLVFSYTGMQSQTIELGNQTTVDVALEPSNLMLEEVVVTGYGEQNRSTFTGSSVLVAPEKIENAPRASFQESLQGNVPGLFSTQGSGQPGAAQSVVIRGLGSISASNQPLYVIDGIPVVSGDISRLNTTTNTLAGLNPNDIESITVLKDASATSIYGSRGANGVIVITTKSGKAGKPRITANIQTGVSSATLTDRNRPPNTTEYLELLREGLINGGYFETQQEAADYLASQIDTTVSTDWFDEVTRQGSYRQANLSLSGGNDNNQYYASAGYYDNEGVVEGSDFRRLSGKLGVNSKVSEWLDFNVNANVTHQNINTVPDGGAFANPVRAIYRLAPWIPVYNEDGSYNTSFNSTYNPVGLADRNTQTGDITNLLGGISFKAKLPIEGLTFEPRANINRIITNEEIFWNPDFGGGRNYNGRAYDYFTQYNDWIVTNLLKYSKYINDAHGIDLTLGQEAQRRTYKSVSTSASNFGVPGLTTLGNAAKLEEASSSEREATISSLFANASYNYQGLFYLNATVRRDGSSRFGANNRYGTFWSVGTSVNFDRLGFMKNSTSISRLRLRASYGVNGNQGIGYFASRGLYSSGYDYNDQPGYILTQLENADLTWEQNKPFNVGVELGLWNRLSVNLDYYVRTTSALLLDVPISFTNGVAEVTRNAGELQNSGVELTISSQNINSAVARGFNWDTDFNISFNQNKVTALPGGNFVDGSFYRQVGEDYYTWYTRGYAGVDEQTGEPLWYTDESETETTTNISEAERYTGFGKATPDFFGGLTNTLSYGGFSLSFQFNFVWGNTVRDTWATYTHSDGARGLSTTGNVARKIYERRWQKPGDVTDVPAFVWGNSTNSNSFSSRFLYDGSFIRLRDLTLSYNLPSSLLQRLRLANVRIFARGNNLWTYIKDDRLERDPQVDYDGFLDQELPISRTFSFGLDLSF